MEEAITWIKSLYYVDSFTIKYDEYFGSKKNMMNTFQKKNDE